MKNKNKSHGFSLIELMIVIAIIGILSNVAISSYQTYAAKSIIGSLLSVASSGRSAMLSRYLDLGEMPEQGTATKGVNQAGSATAGLQSAFTESKYQSTVTYKKNSPTSAEFTLVLANINGNINGKELTFSYQDNGGALTLKCLPSAGLDNQYLPRLCREVINF